MFSFLQKLTFDIEGFSSLVSMCHKLVHLNLSNIHIHQLSGSQTFVNALTTLTGLYKSQQVSDICQCPHHASGLFRYRHVSCIYLSIPSSCLQICTKVSVSDICQVEHPYQAYRFVQKSVSQTFVKLNILTMLSGLYKSQCFSDVCQCIYHTYRFVQKLAGL